MILKKYADLLVHYCLELKAEEKLYIKTTMLAESLVREVYRAAVKAGALVEIDLDFSGKNRIFMEEASENQLQHVSPLYKMAMENFDAFLLIRAPFNLREDQNVDKKN